jgi:hypothetical protein
MHALGPRPVAALPAPSAELLHVVPARVSGAATVAVDDGGATRLSALVCAFAPALYDSWDRDRVRAECFERRELEARGS